MSEETTEQNANAAPAPKKKSKKLIMIVLVVLLLAGGGGGCRLSGERHEQGNVRDPGHRTLLLCCRREARGFGVGPQLGP